VLIQISIFRPTAQKTPLGGVFFVASDKLKRLSEENSEEIFQACFARPESYVAHSDINL